MIDLTAKRTKQISEKDLADFFEQARKDPAQWDSLWNWQMGSRAVSGTQPATTTVYALSIAPADLEVLARYAFEHDIDLDEFIRKAALDAAMAYAKRKGSTPRKE